MTPLVELPRIAARPPTWDTWAELVVSWAITAAAWVVGGFTRGQQREWLGERL